MINRLRERLPPGRETPLRHRVRVVTAASLFDGHDAAIHIMRRILQAEGAEVIHLGHDRSVTDVVDAAIQEDAQAIAVSSYQGGHVEYFSYMVDLLRERGCGHIRVYGGGGGVIVPEEMALLHRRGVARIYSPEDGRTMGLEGMIRHLLSECDHPPGKPLAALPKGFGPDAVAAIARGISTLEWEHEGPSPGGEAEKGKGRMGGRVLPRANPSRFQGIRNGIATRLKNVTHCPVLGITGTGGAGKSSLVDEILIRLLAAFPGKRVAVLCVDPSRRRTGGALLGDRLRVNSASSPRVYFRSLATRRAHAATSAAVKDALGLLKAAGFDLILLETAGIGQSDSEVTDLSDLSLYVMTPEFGAPSQLEKIDMLDYADFVVLNKFDKAGAEDALREVRKAWARNRKISGKDTATLPVFPTCVHRFQDLGTNALCNAVFARLDSEGAGKGKWKFPPLPAGVPDRAGILPRERIPYLREIAATVRAYHRRTAEQVEAARAADALDLAGREIGGTAGKGSRAAPADAARSALVRRREERLAALDPDLRAALMGFDGLLKTYQDGSQAYEVRGKAIAVENFTQSLSGLDIPKVALPATRSWADRAEFLRSENVPGRFPFTAGVFPFRREGEDPTRMFAGEGMAERTNARFHYVTRDVSRGRKAVRLSTAFDSVTLYGSDPAVRPDIYGKVGNSGVSVCCLDDAKRLYSGFDLTHPGTSVSMTINGPAPILLAFFFNAAVDAECERRLKAAGAWGKTRRKIDKWFRDRGIPAQDRPRYRADGLPAGHDGSGLGFLGLPADQVMDRAEYARIRADVLAKVRGTVQADILKEDQAQNTCIFSTEFSLRLMGDTQQYFLDHAVRNFYSVSISGYHIAEAGANPVTQLALTLANGFTYVEYYRARGMDISAFAPNLSFFFSNGLDPEYAVLGRVARRIWAIALRDLYGADERSQKLKYHIQTSGRSLHAREIDFNDIRTTLQALLALADNCNSLHTNAYDEAITTPTEASVRRAIAIQLIINREMGTMRNENMNQGGYFLTRLTDLVEAEVLRIFEELDSRGGVLGAMEANYQRSRIQEESLLYERRKQSGELPIIGVNTYLGPDREPAPTELIRSTEAEKKAQVAQVAAMAARFPEEAGAALARLQEAARQGRNLFAELMEAAKYCTLGAISRALFEVGGAYRRNT